MSLNSINGQNPKKVTVPGNSYGGEDIKAISNFLLPLNTHVLAVLLIVMLSSMILAL